MSNKTLDPREIKIIFEHSTYILIALGVCLFSSNLYTFITQKLYELKKFYNVLVKDRINHNVWKIVIIALLVSEQELSNQLSKYNLKEIEQTLFYSQLIKQKINIFKIKFNLNQLIIALLRKGHLGKIQPSIISKNVK